MKIYAPVKTANGVWCSVRFVDGVGETDNPNLIRWFKEHGYTVEEPQIREAAKLMDTLIENVIEDVSTDEEPDFESMTPNDLRTWMRKNGLGLEMKNIRNKEKLIEIIKAKKG